MSEMKKNRKDKMSEVKKNRKNRKGSPGQFTWWEKTKTVSITVILAVAIVFVRVWITYKNPNMTLFGLPLSENELNLLFMLVGAPLLSMVVWFMKKKYDKI